MDEKEKINRIAEDYFDYISENYPIMCLSDEFYFFPRARKALNFLNILDSLDKEKIKENISYLNSLGLKLEKLNTKNRGLETEADCLLLKESILTFLREFEELKIWQIKSLLDYN